MAPHKYKFISGFKLEAGERARARLGKYSLTNAYLSHGGGAAAAPQVNSANALKTTRRHISIRLSLETKMEKTEQMCFCLPLGGSDLLRVHGSRDFGLFVGVAAKPKQPNGKEASVMFFFSPHFSSVHKLSENESIFLNRKTKAAEE